MGKGAPNLPRCVFVRAGDHDINVVVIAIHPDLDIDRIRLPEFPRHAVAIRRDRRWRRIQTERSSAGGIGVWNRPAPSEFG